MKREERKEWIRKLRQEQSAGVFNVSEADRARREKEMAIRRADDDPDQLCMLSEITAGVFASTITEEITNAIIFADLLKVPVNPNQSVFHFLEDVCIAWREKGSPLLNPLSGRFSPNFTNKVRGFKKHWVFLEPKSDYDRRVSDFYTPQETAPLVESESEKTAASTIPDVSSFGLDDERSNDETAVLFSAQVIPFAHES